jgi:CHAT domain-containing protein/Tfp pilus assembly protein PilF
LLSPLGTKRRTATGRILSKVLLLICGTLFVSRINVIAKNPSLSLGTERLLVSSSYLHTTSRRNDAIGTVQVEQALRSLEYGKPIEREMAGGQAHDYKLELKAEQYVHIVVNQSSIDVALALFGPDGKKLLDVDSPNGTWGPEPISLIVSEPGVYRLVVYSSQGPLISGHYKVEITELRKPLTEDRNRIDAERAFAAATQLLSQGTAASLRGAIDKYLDLLASWQDLKDAEWVATTLRTVGAIYDLLGEKKTALEYYSRVLPIRKGMKDRRGEAQILNNIGQSFTYLGENHKALDYFQRALLLLGNTNDIRLKAVTFNNIGSVLDVFGEKYKALKSFNRALSLWQSVRDQGGETQTLNNIASIYNDLGDKRRALSYLRDILSIKKALGDPSAVATTLNNIGNVYNDLDERENALDYLNQALSAARTLGDRRAESVTLSNLGAVYHSTAQRQKALDSWNQAIVIKQALNDRAGEAYVLNNIAAEYDALGEGKRALDFYDQALTLMQAVGNKAGESITLSNIGYTYQRLGNLPQALDHYEQSIAIQDAIRTRARLDELKVGLAENSALVYERGILIRMRLGQKVSAFELTEKARSRNFLDQLENVRVRSSANGNAQLAQQERSLEAELVELERSLRRERNKPVPELNTAAIQLLQVQQTSKRQEYEEVLVRLKLQDPEYASLRSGSTLTLLEVQRFLDRDTTLISYFVTPNSTLAFVITRDSFQSVELPVKESDLRSTISWFRTFTNIRDLQPQSLMQLHAWLIAPLKPYIKTPIVGIISHSILHYLPFAALEDGRGYLGDEHTIFYLPSASVLPFIQRKAKPLGKTLLAVAQSRAEGLPLLRYADDEANEVARLFNTRPITGSDASKITLVARIGHYSIVHIAAHAELNTANPLFSRIMLAPDKEDSGILAIRDVYSLDLPKASLVTLSACETQLGAQSKGDDIVGLNRAFIYAGTPSVVASLWKVDDEATGILMKSFYMHLLQGMSKAEALGMAQRETRAKYPHPYYWAAFVLTGDPGTSAAVKARRN